MEKGGREKGGIGRGKRWRREGVERRGEKARRERWRSGNREREGGGKEVKREVKRKNERIKRQKSVGGQWRYRKNYRMRVSVRIFSIVYSDITPWF